MKEKIKLIPLSSSGLILSLGLLSILFIEYTLLSTLLFALTLVMFYLLTIKILLIKDNLFDIIDDSVYGAVLGTYPMIFSVIAYFLSDKLTLIGFIFWWMGLVLQIAYLVGYTMKFLTPIKIGEFLPSSYIIFVGIAISSATSSRFYLETIGKLFFLISASLAILMTPLIFRNVVLKKRLTKKTRPTSAIMALPFSLCTLAYMDSFMLPTDTIIIFLIMFTFFFVSIAIVNIVICISTKFNYYISSYAFPMAISSLAMKKAASILLASGNVFGFIAGQIYLFTKIITVVITIYVFIMYIIQAVHLQKKQKILKNK